MSNIVAIVKSLVGQVFAVSLDGLKRQIFEGERLLMGEQLLTGLGGEVTLQLASGELVNVAQSSNWQAPASEAPAEESAAEPDSNLEQALAAGFDPTTDLEATAAGPGAGGGSGGGTGGGHSFVMLGETGQQLEATVGFTTQNPGLGGAGQNDEFDAFADATDSATVQPNRAPTVQADTFTINEDGTISIDVLGNDSDLDGDALSISQVNGQAIAEGGSVIVSNGSVTLTNGQLVFTPNANYNGPASFSYTVTDGVLSSTATINGTVSPVNDAPTVGAALTTTAAEDSASTTLDLLSGAADVDNGDVLTIDNVLGLVNGLSLNGSTLSVDPSHAAFQSLADGVSRDIVITYDVIDSQGGVTPQTATITITGTNDAPVIQSAPTSGDGFVTKPQGLDNHSLANAVNLDGEFIQDSSVDVADSQTVPFVSISSTGANAVDYYSFTVTQAGTTATFDIDYATAGGFDSTLRLYDANGNQLVYSDDSSAALGGSGSTSGLDSYFSYTFSQPGTYYIAVGDWANGSIQPGSTYQLQVSLPNAITTNMLTERADGSANENTGSLSTSGSLDFSDVDLADTHTVSSSLVSTVDSLGSGAAARGTLTTTIGNDSTGDGTGRINWTYNVDAAALDNLAVGQVLTLTYRIEISDGKGGTDTQDIVITLRGTNDAAVIGGSTTGSVDENSATTTASGTLTAADVDNAANVFQANSGTGSYGTFSVTATGEWTYTLDNSNPAVDALNDADSLTDSFTVRSADGTAQVVTVTITGTNDAAVIAGSTTGSVDENSATTTASGTLTAADVDNTTNVFQANSGTASYGTFSVTAGGVWTYTLNNSNPAVDALNDADRLTDSFTVRSADGTAQVVTVTITGTNDAAVIGGTTIGSVDENSATTTARGTLTTTDVDNLDNVFQANNGSANYGTFAVTATGGWTYSLNNSNPAVDALNDADTLTDSFTVRSADGTAQVVTVTITGTNDAAVIDGTTIGSVDENSATTTARGTLTATDVDNLDNVFQANNGSANYGTFAVTATGGWTYSLNNSNPAVDALNDADTLTDSFTVLSADGTAQVVTVTITGSNDAPTVAAALTTTAAEDSASTTLDLLSGAADVDNGDVLTIDNVLGLVNGLSLNGSTLSIDPSHADFQSLADGVSRDIVITYNVVDSQGSTAAQTATITITGTNDDPVIQSAYTTINGQGSITKAQGFDNHSLSKAVSLDGQFVQGSDSDVGNSQTVPFVSISSTGANAVDYYTFTVTQAGTTATFDIDYATAGGFDSTLRLYDANGNQLVYSDDSSAALGGSGSTSDLDSYFSYTFSQPGTYYIAVGSYYYGNIPSGSTYQLQVSLPNAITANMLTERADGSANENTGALSTSGSLDFSDVDLADSHSVSSSLVSTVDSLGSGAIARGTLTTTIGDDSTGDGTGRINWTYNVDAAALDNLAVGQVLTLTYRIEISDGKGGTDTQDIVITLRGTNDAAVIAGSTIGSVDENSATTTATGTLTATDVDNAANAFQVSSGSGSNNYGTFSVTATGGWTYTLNNSNPAVDALNDADRLTDSFTVRSADGTAQVVTVTITGTNDAAVIAGTTTGSVDEDSATTTASGTLTAADVDNADNVFQANSGTASYGTFAVTAGGAWTYTLNNSNPAVDALNDTDRLTDSFTVRSADGTAQVVTVTITGTNDAAVIAGTTTGLVDEDSATTATGTLTAADVDNADNVFQANSGSGSNNYGTFSVTATGGWTYTLNNSNPAVNALNDTGRLTDSFTVLSTDGTAQVVTVTITGTNDAPTVAASLATVIGTEDTAITLNWSNFGVSDVDSLDSDLGVVISQLPAAGSLRFEQSPGTWIAVTQDQAISKADIDAGKLRFEPAADESGYDGFAGNGLGNQQDDYAQIGFKPFDGSTEGASSSLTLDINPVADAPLLSIPQGSGVLLGTNETSVGSGAVTGGHSGGNALVRLADGSFVVAYTTSDGNSIGSFVQRLDSNGDPLGAAIRANTHTTNSQQEPAISALEGGGFVVSWMSANQDGNGWGIYARRFDANGNALDAQDIRLNQTTASDQVYPSITALDGGGFVVSWMSYNQAGSGYDIYARRFDANGNALDTQDVRINQATANEQYYPSITALDGGGFVASWASYNQDGSGWGIYARRFDTNGNPLDAQDIRLNQTTASDQVYQSITALDGGGFVASWASYNQDGSGWDIYARRFDADGNALDAQDIRINQTTASDQFYPSITALDGGGFVASWMSNSQDGSGWDIYARRFDADGNALDAQDILINQTPTGSQYNPHIIALPGGGFAVAYQDGGQVKLRQFQAQSQTPSGDEDSAISLPISVALADIDGSESISSITLSGLPAGSQLNKGTDNGDGSWSLSLADLTGLTLTPPANYHGTLSLTLTATSTETSNGNHASSTLNFEVIVKPVNDAPVANADSASTLLNTPLNAINVLGNDTDVENNPLSVTGATVNPALGTVTVNANNTLSFVPANNITGDVLITYQISDGQGGTASGSLTVTVGANTAPTGANNTVTLTEDGSHGFSATDFGFNDADAGHSLQGVRIDSLPSAGSLTLNGNPVSATQVIALADLPGLLFTPAANANGNAYASFTFSVKDNLGSFDTAPNTLVFNVTPVGDVPTFAGDAAGAVTEDVGVVGNNLSDTGTLSVSDADADQIGFQAGTATAVGTTLGSLTITAAGVWTYTVANADVQYLKVAETKTETFTVLSSDGTPHNVVVTITGTNDLPVINGDAAGAVTEDAGVVGNNLTDTGSLSVSDNDAGQVGFQAGAATAVGITLGSLTITAAGVWTYTVANADVQYLKANEQKVETFTARSADGTPHSIVVTITGTNDLPVVSHASITVAEDSTNTSLGLTVPTDNDGNVLTITVTGLPTIGSVTLANGTPVTNGQVLTPAELTGLQYDAPTNLAANTQATFTYSVNDGTTVVNGSATINVVPTNDAPLVSNATLNVAEDSTDTALGLTAPTDADGNALTITVTGLPTIGSVTLANGTPVTNGQVLTPAELAGLQYDAPTNLAANAQTSFTYSVNDGTTVVNGSATINVVPTNDAPTTTPVTLATIVEDSGARLITQAELLANANDVDSPSLTATSLTIASGNGSLTNNGNGTWTYTPAAHDGSAVSFSYVVTDGSKSVSASANLDITPVADVPALNLNNQLNLPNGAGLLAQTWTGLSLGTNGNGATPNDLQSAIDQAGAPNGTANLTDVSNSSVAAGTASKISGLIYLEAGQTYAFSGVGDDSIRVVVGGNNVAQATWGNGSGQFNGSFTPASSGYYTLSIYHHNQSGPGNYDVNLSVNGGPSQNLNNTNFGLFPSSSAIPDQGERLSELQTDASGSFYRPYGINEGHEGSAIPLSKITAALVDTDGSETLTISITNIPAGSILTDGTNRFMATDTVTSVDISSWNKNTLSFNAPSNFSGTVNLGVTATATESSGVNNTESTSANLAVTVIPQADAPTLMAPSSLTVIAQGNSSSSQFRTVSFSILAALADSSESLAVSIGGVPIGITLSDGRNSFTSSSGNTTANVSTWDLTNLTLTVPTNTDTSAASRTLTITATSTESNGSSSSSSQTITLHTDRISSNNGNSSDNYITVETTSPRSGGSGNDLMIGDGQNNTMAGDSGNDVLQGNSGNDILSGGTDNDRLEGGAGGDTLNGDAGNDMLLGGTGIDTLDGGTDNDYLDGGAENDTLIGGAGDDILFGGAGDDRLTGGTGADTFAWRVGDTGRDTITDFNAGLGDRIDLSSLLTGVGNNDLLSYLRVDTATSTLQISTSGALNENGSNADVTITLENSGNLNPNNLSQYELVNSLIAGADPMIKVDHT